MKGRFLSYACFLFAFPLLTSVVMNDCGDETADGRKEGNTLVSRLAGVERYRACVHTDTIQRAEGEWEWVWKCDAEPALVPKDGSYLPIDPAEIRRSRSLRLAVAVEPWHELTLGMILAFLGFVLYVRSLPRLESTPAPHP